MINGARIKKRLEKMESREKDIGISLKYIYILPEVKGNGIIDKNIEKFGGVMS